jgi:hypothetical protein
MANDKDKKDAKLTESETRELVERVAWEVVPHMAEALIREELKKQLGES